ncbi:Spermidine synthase [Desulfotomaculum nigrificans CO-1-SRB]|uniref:Polyamine aminopropyltransferase n=1 Tax=Desulfotomaculum nigrificans (strain DSM 14880 / VKM B-2319 / CO-1-SRB) TaxID=868595 RepID=F6B478_DESCC|nr:polyamine aminopropyltransferase [Desulfotomaculum nigrificans]AEF95255.1 Spermidine synthase [Desulfotomaculum nigrificans CO-1-SRB]
MDLWFYERNIVPGLSLGLEVTSTVHSEQTEFQHLAIVDTKAMGRVLFLDNIIMTSTKFEFVYHEMITHVALNTHPNPKKVLVIGGGDGGAIREIIKHPRVEKAVLVEIDRRVVETAKEFLPEISCGLNDPRVEVLYQDGIKYVQEHQNEFDIIITDSTDPIGPAVGLFEKGFYESCRDALKEDGIFVAQTESPYYDVNLLPKVQKNTRDIFPITKLYLAFIPEYPGGCWSFTIGSKKYDPEAADLSNWPNYPTRYYNPGIHKAAFVLPNFVRELIK